MLHHFQKIFKKQEHWRFPLGSNADSELGDACSRLRRFHLHLERSSLQRNKSSSSYEEQGRTIILLPILTLSSHRQHHNFPPFLTALFLNKYALTVFNTVLLRNVNIWHFSVAKNWIPRCEPTPHFIPLCFCHYYKQRLLLSQSCPVQSCHLIMIGLSPVCFFL